MKQQVCPASSMSRISPPVAATVASSRRRIPPTRSPAATSDAPSIAPRKHLHIQQRELARELDRLGGAPAGRLDIPCEQKRGERLTDGEQRMLRARLQLGEQTASTLGPPVRDRLLAPEHHRVLSETQGHTRRPPCVAALPVKTIRAFPNLLNRGHAVEPTDRTPQPFERLGRLAVGHGGLEPRPCLWPRSALQRGVSSRDSIGQLGHVGLLFHLRPRPSVSGIRRCRTSACSVGHARSAEHLASAGTPLIPS
jgi:hypothetical protein